MQCKSRLMPGSIRLKSSDSPAFRIWDKSVVRRNMLIPMTDQRGRERVAHFASALAMMAALIFSAGCGSGGTLIVEPSPPTQPITPVPAPITASSSTEQCNEAGNILPAGDVNTDLQISAGTACVVDG